MRVTKLTEPGSDGESGYAARHFCCSFSVLEEGERANDPSAAMDVAGGMATAGATTAASDASLPLQIGSDGRESPDPAEQLDADELGKLIKDDGQDAPMDFSMEGGPWSSSAVPGMDGQGGSGSMEDTTGLLGSSDALFGIGSFAPGASVPALRVEEGVVAERGGGGDIDSPGQI